VVLIPILLVVSALLLAQHRLRVDFTRSLKAIDTAPPDPDAYPGGGERRARLLADWAGDALTALETAQQDIPELLAILEDFLADDLRQIALLEEINSLMEDELDILETLTRPGSSPSDLPSNARSFTPS
jgi:hypothetical protein